MAKVFLDTNIFYYAVDNDDQRKRAIARGLIDRVVRTDEGVASSQVLSEFANNALRKMALPIQEVLALLDGFEDHQVVKADLKLTREAVRLTSAASISFWDALILAAARQAGCTTLYTEDLNHGQTIAGVKIVNPFLQP